MNDINSSWPHIILSSELSEDTKLFRYIRFRHFMDFVETKQTSFARIVDWEDTWEAPPAKLPIKTKDGSVTFNRWNICEAMFGQCWSLHEESDAMWRIYSPDEQGVVIQSSVKKFRLLKGIKLFALGPIIYYDNLKMALDQIEGHREYNIFTEAFLKRRAFEHEKEVRLVMADDLNCLPNYLPKEADRFNLDLDPFKFIEGITIDPRADERYVAVLQQYCERAGFAIKPVKSTLYGNLYEHTRLATQFVPVEKKKS